MNPSLRANIRALEEPKAGGLLRLVPLPQNCSGTRRHSEQIYRPKISASTRESIEDTQYLASASGETP
ncbi:hypothetical protein EYR41_009102 [Orbilia oligospora]|uniref:Uncharacterized protein n=1 Tax=Orbilia oligospora TaxID=2813651 RepID=A0A7C8P8I9_ORBOL|nr:hypothetical protein TWF751_000556 [Orbilia oligospora]TGJ65103.1 hypothetical protein EYR41_009102 [Orbilia oligospora]